MEFNKGGLAQAQTDTKIENDGTGRETSPPLRSSSSNSEASSEENHSSSRGSPPLPLDKIPQVEEDDYLEGDTENNVKKESGTRRARRGKRRRPGTYPMPGEAKLKRRGKK